MLPRMPRTLSRRTPRRIASELHPWRNRNIRLVGSSFDSQNSSGLLGIFLFARQKMTARKITE
jgi:hypothetical protein